LEETIFAGTQRKSILSMVKSKFEQSLSIGSSSKLYCKLRSQIVKLKSLSNQKLNPLKIKSKKRPVHQIFTGTIIAQLIENCSRSAKRNDLREAKNGLKSKHLFIYLE
jgi:hypothetical protein